MEVLPAHLEALPVVDTDEAQRQFGMDTDILFKLVQHFLKSSAVVIEDMTICLREGDYTALARDAHKIKGSALYVAAKQLSACGAALEKHAKAAEQENRSLDRTDLERADQLIAQVQTAFERVKQFNFSSEV